MGTDLRKELGDLLISGNNQETKPVDEKGNKVDFMKEGVELWSKKGKAYASAFELGEMVSNYNTVAQYDHLSFFNGLCRIVNEAVRTQITTNGQDMTNTADILDLLRINFKLLSNNLEAKMKQATKENGGDSPNPEDFKEIDVELLFASFHGFISSYVQKSQ